MKFILANQSVVDNCIKHIYNAFQSDKKYQVELKEFHENRTTQQNKYLFGVCYPVIANEVGYSVEQIHSLMGKKFLCEHDVVLGEEVYKVKSTTKLNKKEFSEYLENVFRFAAEYGLAIPDPWIMGYLER